MKRLTVITAALAAGLTTVAFADTREEMEMQALGAVGAKMQAITSGTAEAGAASDEAEQDVGADAAAAEAANTQKETTEAPKEAAEAAAPRETAVIETSTSKRRFTATREERELKTLSYAAVDPTTTGSTTGAKAVLEAQAKGAAVGAPPSSPYGAIIAKHAAANGVPVALATAVVRVESNFRPSARGAAGEVGLMQIKPATARMMGYSGSTKALYDPETNIRWGMKYLGKAHQLGGGDTCGTILRYNAGHAAKRMNPISAGYCAKVKGLLAGA